MPERTLPFDYVEKQLRRRNFGIIGTVTPDGRSHSTSVIYAVSRPGGNLALYVVTGVHHRKTRNIRVNPNVSFVVPVPYRVLSFVPARCIQFLGTADLLPITDMEGRASFRRSRILRMVLRLSEKDEENAVFIRITPDRQVFGYGLKMGMRELIKDLDKGQFSAEIPDKGL